MKCVNGPIPCEGCGKSIYRGTVHKLDDEIFICDSCHRNGVEMQVMEMDGLEQFDEYVR